MSRRRLWWAALIAVVAVLLWVYWPYFFGRASEFTESGLVIIAPG